MSKTEEIREWARKQPLIRSDERTLVVHYWLDFDDGSTIPGQGRLPQWVERHLIRKTDPKYPMDVMRFTVSEAPVEPPESWQAWRDEQLAQALAHSTPTEPPSQAHRRVKPTAGPN